MTFFQGVKERFKTPRSPGADLQSPVPFAKKIAKKFKENVEDYANTPNLHLLNTGFVDVPPSFVKKVTSYLAPTSREEILQPIREERIMGKMEPMTFFEEEMAVRKHDVESGLTEGIRLPGKDIFIGFGVGSLKKVGGEFIKKEAGKLVPKVKAFFNKTIGDIDSIKGNKSTPQKSGFGLDKIEGDHPEVLPYLEEAISNAKVVQRLPQRTILESQGENPIRIIIDHQLGKEPKTFLNNAYFKNKAVPRGGIEPPTPASSEPRSATELPRQANVIPEKGKSQLIKAKVAGIIKAKPTELPEELVEKRLRLSFLKEEIENHPAKDVGEYVTRRGEFQGQLAEVTGEKGGGRFKAMGDELASERGYEDSKALRKGYDEFKKLKENFETLKTKTVEAEKKFKISDKDNVVLENFLRESSAKTETQVGFGQQVINDFVKILKGAKVLRKEQELLYTQERAKKLAIGKSIAGKTAGETGFYAEKGALKGELPKIAEFENIKNQMTQEKIDQLFDIAKNHPEIGWWESITARSALGKVLTGKIPTEGELVLLNKIYGKQLTTAIL